MARGGGGGGNSHTKVTRVLVVPFRGYKYGFGTSYGVQYQNFFRCSFRGTFKGINEVEIYDSVF